MYVCELTQDIQYCMVSNTTCDNLGCTSLVDEQVHFRNVTNGSGLNETLTNNLATRSLVDEAEGQIWQSKKICFSWLAAPFDSCPIPSLKIDATFRGRLSSNSSSGNFRGWWKWKADKKRREEERFGTNFHSGLNNFCNMIVPLPKSQTRHPARAQAPLHLQDMLTFQTLLPVCIFFALTRSPNLRTKTACRELKVSTHDGTSPCN